MKALECTKCGGALEVPEDKVYESDNLFILKRGHIFTCPFCGMSHTEQSEGFKSSGGNVVIQSGGVNISGGGNVTIIGDLVAGNLIKGDKVEGNDIYADLKNLKGWPFN